MTDDTIDFQPTSQEFSRNPFPLFRAMRERDPVYRWEAGGAWVLTRHDDVMRAMDGDPHFTRDSRISAREQGRRPTRPGMEAFYEGSLTRTEGEQHRRLRGLVSKAFTARAIARMEPRIQQIVDQLLGPLRPGQRVDLVPALANPLPAMSIARLIGIPEGSDLERDFKALSDRMIRISNPLLAEEDKDDVEAAIVELIQRLQGLIEDKRHHPADDVLSGLIAAREAGDRLTEREMLGTLIIIVLGGTETTTNVLSHSIIELAKRPEVLAELARDPALWPGAIEELLRFQPPGKLRPLFMAKDLTLRGRQLKRGDIVFVSQTAASRDPAIFDDADAFDIRRDCSSWLGFGRGEHYCLGASLARLELLIGLRTLFERFPELKLETTEPEYETHLLLRVIRALPVRL